MKILIRGISDDDDVMIIVMKMITQMKVKMLASEFNRAMSIKQKSDIVDV